MMCEAAVTNAEPSEDNSISAVKVSEVAIAKGGLDRMQLVGRTSIPLTVKCNCYFLVADITD